MMKICKIFKYFHVRVFRTAIIFTFLACIMLMLCHTFSLPTSSQDSLSIPHAAYDQHATSTDEILQALLNSMAHNESVCHIWVNDQALINANNWLNLLPGIEQIHCEYCKISSGYNMVVTLQYWDNYPIVYAYKSNNSSYLNAQQLSLYHKYCEVLSSNTSPDKTACANELSIHDYLVTHINYVESDTSSYNAYNALINGQAVCSGYAECFKTFMDMLGIENTTISGTAGGQQHIWNEVFLDGEWYQVDVTWDDPVATSDNDTAVTNVPTVTSTDTTVTQVVDHTYFNIPDCDMIADHTWDSNQTGYRSATGTQYSYARTVGLTAISTQDELANYLADCVRSRNAYVEFTTSTTLDLKSALSTVHNSFSYSYKTAPYTSYSYYTMQFFYK